MSGPPSGPSRAPAGAPAPAAAALVVAIDGGAASGKSSTARALAERFDLLHVDTGSHYRAATSRLLEAGVAPDDAAGLAAALGRWGLATQVEGRTARIVIDGRVATGEEVRRPEVTAAVSAYAARPELRAWLLGYQRGQAAVARAHGLAGLVVEGRDIGSVVFPRASVRVFLTADPEERARRRAAQGERDAVRERDRRDTTRSAAPLTCPAGALVIDSTHLGLDEVVGQVARAVEAAAAAAAGGERPRSP